MTRPDHNNDPAYLKGYARLRYIDVCSGISAPTAAWKPLGWQALCFAEIEAAPRAVLAHHYPDTPLRGDFTEIEGNEYGPVDLLVGGTPCQSFSVAGLRGGLADDRGNLSLQFARLAGRARPRWVVWENVPGVLSSNGGRDFGSILGALAELGYGCAYRVLDAQHFGVPQRRRRVFIVGYLGDWRRAAAVLFERHSLSGHPAPRREAGERIARPIAAGSANGSGYRNDADTADNLIADWPAQIAGTLDAHYGDKMGLEDQHVFNQRGSRFVPATAYQTFGDGAAYETGHITVPVRSGADNSASVVAFNITPSNSNKDFNARKTERAQALTAGGNRPSGRGGDLIATHAVRRLTPRECERLQGFRDDFTLVPHRNKPMADGPRYKMLGNSMAVPVLRWIGERINAVEAHSRERIAA